VQFGVFGSAESDRGFSDYLDYCVAAEELGFHSSFLVEHHFSGWNQVSATLMLQACAAMRTTRLRLGTAVIVLPWHNPVLLAEQVATLDVVSGGRVDLGVGRGYRYNEFTGFAIPAVEADERFEESLEVLLKSWSCRDRFSHAGRFWRFDDVVVEPPPIQEPHPPIWVAAASEASVRRAGRRGFNLLLDQYASTEKIAERLGWYRSERHDFSPDQVAVARQVYVADDARAAATALEQARALAERNLRVSRRPDGRGGPGILSYDGATEEHALYGTAELISSELDRLEAIGVAYVLVLISVDAQAQLPRFAAEVMAPLAAAAR
jgi:alkanesulfonate monooxygenase SsuD/methylene tetrahydromethanopterin reductase-like flavin-dependent oxidoreductase (luciferase family)